MGRSLGLFFPVAWDEPFGLVLVEAMATGTPVIAFEGGAASEVFRHGETGFLIAPKDCARAAALGNELPSLALAPCRAHVAGNFSRLYVVDAYCHCYGELGFGFL